MLVSDAVSKVVSEGGFDTSSSNTSADTVRSWVNERVREALATSKYRKATVEIGPTVAGQAQYALPEHVVDVRALRVASGRRWTRASTEELYDLQGGDAWLRSSPGAFAANFEADTDPVVELWPAPDEDGSTITLLAAVSLEAELATGDTIPLPSDLAQRIAVDGAIALGRRRIDEREDLAAGYELRFEKAVQELSRRANSRMGSGPHQIGIRRPGR